MKRKGLLALVVLLCVTQIITAIAILPVGATASTKTYNIERAVEIMTVDGLANEEIWSTVESSEAFVNTSQNSIDNFSASYKAVWTPCVDDTSKMNVYIFITASGYTTVNSWRNNIRIQIETPDASHRYWSGQQQLNNVKTGSPDRTCTVGTTATPFKLFAINDIENSKSATYEFCYTMPKSDTIKLDVLVNANTSDGKDATYSWVSIVTTPTKSDELLGIGKIIDNAEANGDVDLLVDGQIFASLKKNSDGKITLPEGSVDGAMLGWKDSAGKLYAVGSEYTVTGTDKVTLEAVAVNFSVLKGASVLIDDPSALRFDISADISGLTEVQAFGALIIPSASLTDGIISDGNITKEELDTAQITYDSIDLRGSADSEIYYAKKENITDFTLKYSVSAYLTVKYADDTTKTLTSAYNATDHSRCVKEVAEAAYADRSNLRENTNGVDYAFKVSKDYAVGDFTLFSYSPYEESSLDVLAELKK